MVVLERDYRAALRDAAGDGYDVVVDPLYGPALEAGLAATAPGARIEEAWERQARGPHHKITLVP